jgi:glycogen synthase
MKSYQDIIKKNYKATKVVLASQEIAYLPKAIDPAGIIQTGDGGGLAVQKAAEFEAAYEKGLDAHIIIPEYYDLFRKQSNLSSREFERELTNVANHPNVHLIDDPLFLHADKVYGDTSYALNRIDIRRAVHFTKGIMRVGRDLNRIYSETQKIIQLNDWSTALASAGLKEYDTFNQIKTEMKWHNTFTQIRPLHKLNEHGFNTQRYHKQLFYANSFPSDNHGQDMYRLWVDYLTTGFLIADQVTAVGDNILKEAVTITDYNNWTGRLEQIGVMPKHMGDMLRHRYMHKEAGAVPNEPSALANPQINPLLEHKYGTEDIIEGKRINKVKFQKIMGLEENDAPIIYWPHRIADPQKGAKLFIESIDELMQIYAKEKLQIAFVASGEEYLIDKINILQQKYPTRISRMSFDIQISELGKAGSDFIMMPSLYEPRGYPQLECPNYGTWTLASSSVDGVIDYNLNPMDGNGWAFNYHDFGGIKYVVNEAMKFYKKPLEFREKNLQRARVTNLREHNIEKMINKQIETWKYMLRKDMSQDLILRKV